MASFPWIACLLVIVCVADKIVIPLKVESQTKECLVPDCQYVCLPMRCPNMIFKWKPKIRGRSIEVDCADFLSCYGNIKIEGTRGMRNEGSILCGYDGCRGAEFHFYQLDVAFIYDNVRESKILFEEVNVIIKVEEEQFKLNQVYTEKVKHFQMTAAAGSVTGSIFYLNGVTGRIFIQCGGFGACDGSFFVVNRCEADVTFSCHRGACDMMTILVINNERDCKKYTEIKFIYKAIIHGMPPLPEGPRSVDSSVYIWYQSEFDKGQSRYKVDKVVTWIKVTEYDKQAGMQEMMESIKTQLVALSKRTGVTKMTVEKPKGSVREYVEYLAGVSWEAAAGTLMMSLPPAILRGAKWIPGHGMKTMFTLSLMAVLGGGWPLIVPGAVIVGWGMWKGWKYLRKKYQEKHPDSGFVDLVPELGELGGAHASATAHQQLYDIDMEYDMVSYDWMNMKHIEFDDDGKMIEYDFLTGKKYDSSHQYENVLQKNEYAANYDKSMSYTSPFDNNMYSYFMELNVMSLFMVLAPIIGICCCLSGLFAMLCCCRALKNECNKYDRGEIENAIGITI